MWVSLVTIAALGHAVSGMAVQKIDNINDIRERPDGFSACLFHEDFVRREGDVYSPDPAKWTIDLGHQYPNGPENWGTGEMQTYTRNGSNIQITHDQTLRITPISTKDGEWTSARIETTKDWDFTCAPKGRLRVQARIKLGDNPKARSLGIWPAFWVLGADYRGNCRNWPSVGEVDILETANGEHDIRHAVHSASGGIPSAIEPFSRGVWHTVAWEVDRRQSSRSEESMSWYIDDRLSWTLGQNRFENRTDWDILVGKNKMILLNVAVGGGFPSGMAGVSTPTPDTLGGEGASMEVDYVSVWTDGADRL